MIPTQKPTPPTPKSRRPKDKIPAELRLVHAEVVAKAADFRDQGKHQMEACEDLNKLGFTTRTGKLWQHPQQIMKRLWSFHEAESG